MTHPEQSALTESLRRTEELVSALRAARQNAHHFRFVSDVARLVEYQGALQERLDFIEGVVKDHEDTKRTNPGSSAHLEAPLPYGVEEAS